MRKDGVTVPIGWIVAECRPRTLEIRGGMVSDFQLVCGAGPYEVDVLVRGFESPAVVDIAGQVTRADRFDEPVSDLPLALVESQTRRIEFSTSTNEFGEFGFSSSPGPVYGIRLGDGEDAPCVLVWEGYP